MLLYNEAGEEVESINIEGVEHFTIEDFAKIVGKSISAVRVMISRGNSIRKLKTEKYGGKPFIPISEVTDYPFPVPGRPLQLGKLVVYYSIKENGRVVIGTEVRFDG